MWSKVVSGGFKLVETEGERWQSGAGGGRAGMDLGWWICDGAGVTVNRRAVCVQRCIYAVV